MAIEQAAGSRHAQRGYEERRASDSGSSDIVLARAFQGKESNPMYRAFARPAGLLGRLAGWIMARSNRNLNHSAVKLLDLRQGDAVLEIGFGPGVALEMLAQGTGDGLIAGIDGSGQMLHVASRRNQASIANGRMRLAVGLADSIPWPDETFNAILSVSSVQFWNPASKSLAEVLRVLKPGGKLVLGIHTMEVDRKAKVPGLMPEEISCLLQQLQGAGFVAVSRHEVVGVANAACICAMRPVELRGASRP